jgi:general secretion pathway protein A
MEPFSISPNPNFLYLTPSIKSVLHKVRYTIESRQGLTCILGDVGLGKSSILRMLYSEYEAREDIVACLIPTPSYISDFAFVKGVCQELQLPPKRSLYDQEDELRNFLLSKYGEGKNVVVFIDEAQRLNGKMLERVRTMLNFETSQEKLIQLVLAGQLELRDRLKDSSKKAIRSRIFAPSMLDPLSLSETQAIIAFRCLVCDIPNPFSATVVERIYAHSGGVPREVLKICSIAHQRMKISGEEQISINNIEQVIKEYAILL